MLKEYAIDPAVAGDFSNLKQIANLFDFSNPRRISRFPKKWERMVYEAAAPLGDMNAKRVEEKLKQFKGSKSCLYSFGRDYDSDKNWIDNALSSHGIMPFNAIICENDQDSCVKLDDLEDTHPLIHAPNSQQVTKSLENYKALFDPLFMSVKNICIVDPYFSTYEDKAKRLYSHWFKLLSECSDAEAKKLSIITSDKNGGPYKLGEENTLITQARQTFANGQDLRFILNAKVIAHSDDMHDRFVIIDNAAFSITSSLIIDDNATMLVNMMTKAVSDGLLSRFDD
ncbi:MAG: hypothetical protein ACLFU1_03835 [Alphaproteobacteria bacterium]